MEKTNNMISTNTKEEILKEIKGIKVFIIKCLEDCASHITGTGTVTGTKILDVSLNLEIILIKKNIFSNPML